MMLKNHWYAVEFGSAVDLVPHPIRLFGQPFVLYRDCLGALVCHLDLCAHCGGSLSAGAVAGDRIRCADCAREYDLDGVCTVAPDLEPGAPMPLDARVDSYPSVEQYGYVFVFLGDLPGNRRPPGPRLPVLDVMPYAQAHGHRIVTGEVSWDAHYEQVIEHSLDLDHMQATPATPPQPDVIDLTERHDELEEAHVGLWLTGVMDHVALAAPQATGIRKLTGAKADEFESTRVGVFFPNLTMLSTPVPGGMMRIFTAVVPVDETHSVSKWTMCRTFSNSALGDSSARRRVKRLLDAERARVEGPDAASGLLVDAYRAWRETVLSWGWGIEQPLTAATEEWTATRVIPSPGRRFPPETSQAWVLPELRPLEARRDAS